MLFGTGAHHDGGTNQQHAGDNQRQGRLVGIGQAARKAKAQSAPTGVGQAELHRRLEQGGPQGRYHHQGQQAGSGRKFAGSRIAGKQHGHQRIALEHLFGITMKAQGLAGDQGVAVKVAQLANLGPRKVDAQCDQRQQQVDNPDSEIFTAGAGKNQRQVLGRFVFPGYGIQQCFHGAPLRDGPQP